MSAQLKVDRVLDLPSLRRLVSRIAADPDTWRPLVNLDAEHRHFAQLWRDDHVDVWVISWMNGHDTGFHDHDLSRAAPPAPLRHRHELRLRRLPRPPHAPGGRRAGDLDPRVFAAAVAHGLLRHRA